MKWFHKCDLGWLQTRQKCLTATDVKELIPFTKTGRPRPIGDEQYLKVMARKMVNITEDDCVSTGAAARGHILEPYAIAQYNKADFGGNEQLYHWDDVVVTKEEHVPFGLAFSPDAMNIPCDVGGILYGATSSLVTIGEVKSYSSERHMLCGYTDPSELEERWQIATAMATAPTIEKAYLLFFNPSMRTQLYIVDYDRSDLEDEISIILDVEENWLSWIANLGKLEHSYLVPGELDSEQRIIEHIIEKEKLNPDSEKSVIV